ncbi:MAG: hypothetical protein E7450_05935 [Ruminococcaceae bacterium]|nr:hypothetical protein [Oscillospiraceae bacterium]
MKKRAVLFILMLSLVAGMLALPVLAAPTASVDAPEAPAQSVTDPPAETPAVETPDASQDAPAEQPTEQPQVEPTVDLPLTLLEQDVVISANVATLSEQAIQTKLTEISACKKFPIVFDWTALPETVNILSVPKEIIDAINTAYQAAGVKTDAIKAVTKTHEYAWSGDKVKELAASTSPSVMLVFQEARAEVRQEAVRTATTEFEAEADREFGILLVSRDAAGQWQVTGQSLYSSALLPVLILVLLILVMLVAIIVVNLIIIKIYRSQM